MTLPQDSDRPRESAGGRSYQRMEYGVLTPRCIRLHIPPLPFASLAGARRYATTVLGAVVVSRSVYAEPWEVIPNGHDERTADQKSLF